VLRRYARGEHDQVVNELEHLRANLASTVREVRSVLADLSLEVLSTYGLAVALQGHIKHFSEATGIEVTMSSTFEGRLSPAMELLMYRLTQEALANIRKHSGARRAAVQLEEKGSALYLTVSDDGRGFNVEEALSQQNALAGHKMGLRSMRQRVQVAGGDLQIFSKPSDGTTLLFWCPLEQ